MHPVNRARVVQLATPRMVSHSERNAKGKLRSHAFGRRQPQASDMKSLQVIHPRSNSSPHTSRE